MKLYLAIAAASAATSFAARADAAETASMNRTITIVNNSSEPILKLRVQASDCCMRDDLLEGRQLFPGQSVSLDFTEQGVSPTTGKKKRSCMYDFVTAVMPHEHGSGYKNVNVCQVIRFVVDDLGSQLEIGGPGKGPVKSAIRHAKPEYTAAGTSPRYAWATDSGCLILHDFNAETKADLRTRRSIYHWDGAPCAKGQFITGQGILTISHDLRVTTGKPGRARNFYRGRMVDGVWDGPVNHSDDYPGIGSKDYGSFTMTMGCAAKDIQFRSCFPHQRGSVAPVVTP